MFSLVYFRAYFILPEKYEMFIGKFTIQFILVHRTVWFHPIHEYLMMSKTVMSDMSWIMCYSHTTFLSFSLLLNCVCFHFVMLMHLKIIIWTVKYHQIFSAGNSLFFTVWPWLIFHHASIPCSAEWSYYSV